jgi:hypothetical protein
MNKTLLLSLFYLKTPRAGTTIKHFQKLSKASIENDFMLLQKLSSFVTTELYYDSLKEPDVTQKLRYAFPFNRNH